VLPISEHSWKSHSFENGTSDGSSGQGRAWSQGSITWGHRGGKGGQGKERETTVYSEEVLFRIHLGVDTYTSLGKDKRDEDEAGSATAADQQACAHQACAVQTVLIPLQSPASSGPCASHLRGAARHAQRTALNAAGACPGWRMNKSCELGDDEWVCTDPRRVSCGSGRVTSASVGTMSFPA
jgi:hypothetical protein